MNLKKLPTLTLCAFLAQTPFIPTALAQSYSTVSGLNYHIVQDGHGKKPSLHDEVEIRFIAYDSKGEILEGTLNDVPVILPISEMFTGLKESLLLMPVGATYEFDIPAHLGYQEEGRSGKHAAKYRIELLRINP